MSRLWSLWAGRLLLAAFATLLAPWAPAEAQVGGLVSAEDGQPIDLIVPYGVPAPTTGRATGSVVIKAYVPGFVGNEFRLTVRSLAGGGGPIDGIGDGAGVPPIALQGEHGLLMKRMASRGFEDGYQWFLSEPLAVIADPRASVAYVRTARENEQCIRCDSSRRPAGAREILSGETLAVEWPASVLTQLSSVYGAERVRQAQLRIPSVRWEVSPSTRQEPSRQVSTGAGDVIPGTLLHSGEVTQSAVDASLPGRGIPVAFERTYRNQTIGFGPLGPGWDHSYRMRLRVLPNGDVELYDGRGRRDVFRSEAAGTLKAPPGWFAELKRLSSGFELTLTDHSAIRFDAHGRMVSLRDRLKIADNAGNEVRFRYDASDRLTAIDDDLGQVHRLTYNAEGHLTRFTDSTGREWKYGYNPAGLLATVTTPALIVGESTFPAGLVTRYEYSAATGPLAERLASRDDLRSITDPRGIKPVEWDYSDADGDGCAEEVTTERWGGKALGIFYRFAANEAEVRDRRNALFVYRHDPEGRLTRIQDPIGAVTTFTLDAEGLVTESVAPLGRVTRVTYDTTHGRRARGNVLATEFVADGRGPNGSGPVLRSTVEYHSYSNQPTKIVDPRGAVTRIVRGETGLPTSITEADGTPESGTTRFEYDAFGRLTKTTDPTGRVVALGYGAGVAGRGQLLRTEADPAGLRIESLTERNSRGEVTSTVDPRGVRSEVVRNELGWVVEEHLAVTGSSDGAPALGYVTRHLHDALGQVIESRLPFGDDTSTSLYTRIVREFGVAGELLSERREVTPNVGDFVETTSTYDDRFQPEVLTGPEDQVTRNTYDDRGLLISVLRGSGTPGAAEATFEYDAEGQRTASTDGRGKVWTTRYDGFGRVKEVVGPLGNLARLAYDAGGNPTSQESLDAAAAVLARSRTAFDLRGRPFEDRQALFTNDIAAARDLLSRRGFDAAGRLLTTVDPKGRTTTFGYDAAGRSNLTVDPIQNRIESTFDAAGNAVSIKTVEVLEGGGSAEVTETAKFDALGRRIEARDGLGNRVETIYDARGQVRKVIDAEGFFTDVEYDGLGRPTRETKPEGIEVTFGYDLASRLTSYVDALGNTTIWTYDALDRKRSIRYADGTTEHVAYDDNDNVLETIDARGNAIQWSYDDAGRLTARQLTTRALGVPGPASESHQYDGLDRLISSQRGTQLVERRYDSLSRLLSDQQGANAVLFQLDDVGNAEEITYPSGYKLAQAFDAANRLTSIRRGATQLASYGYRGFGLPTSVTLPGLSGSMTYDGARRRTATSYGVPGGPERYTESISWSPRDLKTASSRGDQNQSTRLFGYDGAGRLAEDVRQKNATPANNTPPDLAALRRSAERRSFVYDVAQNLLNRQQTSSSILEAQHPTPNDGSGRNRPGSVNGTPLAWDASGQLVSKGSRQYLWDAWGRLAEVKENDSTVATYRYDAFNRLVEKETPSGVETTVYSGWNPIERYANGQLQSRRVYGEGFDSLVRQEVDQDSDGQIETTHSPIFDSTGSVAMLVSDAGQIVETYKVDAYGGVKSYVDSTPPAIHQIAEDAGGLQFLLSEEVDSVRILQSLASGTLALVRTSDGSSVPLTVEVPPQSEGAHTWRIRLTPSNAIAVATPMELRLGERVFVDAFGNGTEAATKIFAWPAAGATVEDSADPRILAVRVRANRIEVALSEAADVATLAQGLKVDTASTVWTASEGGLLLTSGPVSTGNHALEATVELHDRAGKALGNTNSWAFSGSFERIVYRLPDPRETEASSAGNRFVFHGRDFDADAGLVYFRNRWLDPEIGRFVSQDPMGYADGPATTAFAGNSPTAAMDPLGLEKDFGLSIEELSAVRVAQREAGQRKAETCRNDDLSGICSSELGRLMVGTFGDDGAEVLLSPDTDPMGRAHALYVNGVWNRRKSALDSGVRLTRHLGRPVDVLWNPMQGPIEDLLQVILVNKPGFLDATTTKLVRELRQRVGSLPPGENLLMIAHSQGGAVTASALAFLTREQRSRIDLTTYGEAAWSYPRGLASHRRVVNLLDPVPVLFGGGSFEAMAGRSPEAVIDPVIFVRTVHPLAAYLAVEKRNLQLPQEDPKAERRRRSWARYPRP